ncbi:TRAP transporter small permease subunit [Roseomonas sp. PWR1]|uniref:TRAP transporter small permease protein n=1 Tax=Roseomonas nitratireducens TaxID=2820810 RepID=A0ABS4ARR6_9PROT|nr:TRAP transporter small permease subunit [Neoroseomonas nitratireducens]MBP0464045.1 TRAP transporter small permease subunit [Neoroseomonas nitratireducens]
MRFLLRLAEGADAVNRAIGLSARWLAVALVLVQFAVVVLRYAYGSSFVWMQEGVIYLHAFLFMLAIGYAYLLDAHVRVDFFSAAWSERTRAWVELAGILVAVLPFCWLLVWASWGYVARSFMMGEGPMQVGGLPLQPYLKGLILAMAGLLAIQALSVAVRAVAVILGAADTVFPARQQVSEG